MVVIVYVFDSLRADFLGCYGCTGNMSPNLDALARDSVVYENAYTTATWTQPAAASIITSQYPRSLGVMHEMSVIPDYYNTLPKTLKEHGYSTYAISANIFFSPFFGFNGFDEFFVLQMDREVMGKRQKVKDIEKARLGIWKQQGIDRLVKPLSEDINQKLFPILSNRVGNKFILAWSNDTHSPYFADSPNDYFAALKSRNIAKLRSLYGDMVRYNDIRFGELVGELRECRLYDDSLIVVAGDHGESFGEHSVFGRPLITHGSLPYEEVIRVPLIVKYPQGKYAGMRCGTLVQLLDIYPTILGVCGIRRDVGLEGVSLNPAADSLARERTIFIESQRAPHHLYSAAIRKGDYKLIKIGGQSKAGRSWRAWARVILLKFVPEFQLFDLRSDPQERRNLSKKQKGRVGVLAAEYIKIQARLERKRDIMKARRLKMVIGEKEEKEVKKRLRELGYL